MKRLFLLTFVLVISACELENTRNDYDLACDVFDAAFENELELAPSVLLTNMKKQVGESSEVYTAWAALVHMEPLERYPAFKSVAEEGLNVESWDCGSMKALAHTWEH